MSPQPTGAFPGNVRTVPAGAPHRHGSACFWDVYECRWQCVTYPGFPNALERGAANGRPITRTDRETQS
jgi:hypothetical protein